jgi:hypothetical protein
MKYINILVLFISLTGIDSINAKAPRAAQPIAQKIPAVAAPAKPAFVQPIAQPAPQPVVQKQTFKDLITSVKNDRNAWDPVASKLNQNFVNNIVQKAHDARLEDSQVDALLKTARDAQGVFSGNPHKDIAILNAVDEQIRSATR